MYHLSPFFSFCKSGFGKGGVSSFFFNHFTIRTFTLIFTILIHFTFFSIPPIIIYIFHPPLHSSQPLSLCIDITKQRRTLLIYTSIHLCIFITKNFRKIKWRGLKHFSTALNKGKKSNNKWQKFYHMKITNGRRRCAKLQQDQQKILKTETAKTLK